MKHVPSSTSSSRAQRGRFSLDLLIFAFGVYASLVAVWLVDRTGFWAVIDVDPDVASKWQPPSRTEDMAVFMTRPGTPTGRYFTRRRAASYTGNVLAAVPRLKGLPHPYGELEPIRARYGRYGFRDELPAKPEGTAVIGSSYVEAGFANAEDTIPGWLQRDHELAASNFGVAYSGGGGDTALHYLERYVLPTRPKHVVWVVAERADLEVTLQMRLEIEAYRRPSPRLTTSLGGHLYQSSKGFVESAFLRALDSRDQWARGFGLASNADAAGGWSLAGLSREEAQAVVAHYAKVLPKKPLRILTLGDRHHPIDLNEGPSREVLEHVIPILHPILQDMKAACFEAGASFSVVFLPSRETLFAGSPALSPPIPAQERNLSYQVLSRLCAKSAIPVTDSTPALRRALAKGELIHNPVMDHHLNAKGMRLVAAEIAQLLR